MRFRRRGLPLAAVLLAMVVGLGTLGVAYGLWSKTLTIDGTVHTGTLHGKWVGAICSEFHPWPYDIQTYTSGEFEGKDVGSTTVQVDPQDDNNLLLTIDNAYPSYAIDCEVEFTNDGTIPWKIRGIDLQAASGNLTGCTTGGSSQTLTIDCDQLSVVLVDGLGAQYEPGETAASSLRLHLEQPADQNTTYNFLAKVCVGQWNEDATPEECFGAAP